MFISDAAEVIRRQHFTFNENSWLAQKPQMHTKARQTNPAPVIDMNRAVLIKPETEIPKDLLELYLASSRSGAGPLESLKQLSPAPYLAVFKNAEGWEYKVYSSHHF